MRRFNPFTYLWLLKELAGFGFAAVSGTWAWLKIRKAPSWPSAQGRVTSARAANQSWLGWACVVSYTYIANSEYYAGSYAIRAWTKKRAENLATTLKERPITVRYSPTDHALSALLRGDQIGGFSNF